MSLFINYVGRRSGVCRLWIVDSTRDDYKGVDAKGKIVLLLPGGPVRCHSKKAGCIFYAGSCRKMALLPFCLYKQIFQDRQVLL